MNHEKRIQGANGGVEPELDEEGKWHGEAGDSGSRQSGGDGHVSTNETRSAP